MKFSTVYVLMACLLLPATSTYAGSTWTGNNQINRIIHIDGLNRVRLLITATTNPAGCDNSDYLDFILDADGRTELERRILLDIINTAFITNKTVKFYIDELNCTEGGTTIRIGTGIQVLRTPSS